MVMGLKFGVDLVRTHLSIEASNPSRLENERYQLPIPLPGVDTDVVLVKDLWLRQRLGVMYLPINNYAGLMIDLNLSIEYSLFKNVSLGLGVDLLRVRLEKTPEATSGGSSRESSSSTARACFCTSTSICKPTRGLSQ